MSPAIPPDSSRPAEPSTTLAMVSLVLGIVGLPTGGGLIVFGLVGMALGAFALRKARTAPATHGGRRYALAGVALNFIAILLPFIFLSGIGRKDRTASANESATIGDLRSLMSAEEAYREASGGVYGTPECLRAPAECLPGYAGVVFTDPLLASMGPRSGYNRTFHPGPAALSPSGAARSLGLQSYAITAVPRVADKSGTRGFCADSTGKICATQRSATPELTAGRCSASCESLDGPRP